MVYHVYEQVKRNVLPLLDSLRAFEPFVLLVLLPHFQTPRLLKFVNSCSN